MKKYTTNDAFFELFKQQKCTQIEMGNLTGLDKYSVHDWLKHKNEMRFSNLEAIAEKLGKTLKITIE